MPAIRAARIPASHGIRSSERRSAGSGPRSRSCAAQSFARCPEASSTAVWRRPGPHDQSHLGSGPGFLTWAHATLQASSIGPSALAAACDGAANYRRGVGLREPLRHPVPRDSDLEYPQNTAAIFPACGTKPLRGGGGGTHQVTHSVPPSSAISSTLSRIAPGHACEESSPPARQPALAQRDPLTSESGSGWRGGPSLA